jgi:hypothetical protein
MVQVPQAVGATKAKNNSRRAKTATVQLMPWMAQRYPTTALALTHQGEVTMQDLTLAIKAYKC